MSSDGPTSECAIAAHNLGKCYQVYDRPQDRLKQAIWHGGRRYYREFWALRDVSFEVRRGDAVGVVGRNGSGKSTLLQIIAGTLNATEGEVAVNGRVVALLELGSGFNLEFTGRENIFMNGAVLGIPRSEMLRRFDRIASFADIGDFLDQPVKTYSSGMHARLAFAVAFSIDPDILIVDEILAVGDIGFQQKCLARLRHLRENGMTMLFVSHGPDAIRSVCQKGLFLDQGRAVFFGPAERTVDLYLAHVREHTNRVMLQEQTDLAGPVGIHKAAAGQTRYGTGHVQLESIEILDGRGERRRAFRLGEPIAIEITLHSRIEAENLSVSFLVRDQTGIDLMGTTTFDERVTLPRIRPSGRVKVRFAFENALRTGNFGVSAAVTRVSQRDYSDVVLFDQVDACATFMVLADPDRPVHYKFHQPVSIDWEVLCDGS